MVQPPLIEPQNEEVAPAAERRAYAPFSLRALLIGLALSPVLIFWGEYTETVSQGADLIAMSLVMAVVAALLGLIVINLIVKRLAPRYALSQAELLLIYTINATSIGICGIGMMQFLNAQLAGVTYFATPQNHWDRWIGLVPRWALPSRSAVAGYYAGHTTFFQEKYLLGWLQPIIIWTVFIFVLLFSMYCIGALLRRQWVDREKLLFPIVIIPLEITQNGGATPLWRNKMLWAGFGLASILESLAAIHYSINPAFPYFPIKPSEGAYNIGQYMTTPPWNGVGYLVLSCYPLVIGLSYLLTVDVSFSIWFFYIVMKLENVTAVALGFRDPGAGPALSKIPYSNQQDVGAFIGLALISLYLARPHLAAAFRTAFGRRDMGEDDANEMMSYRAAYLGLFASAVFLVVFGTMLGFAWWVSVVFFALFFLFAITFSRLRAEAGIPWGGGPSPYVHGTMVDIGGSENYSAHSLVGFSFTNWFDSDFRALAMPSQLEAMKISDRRIHPRQMTVAILIAIVVATLASWVSELGIYYHFGAASSHVNSWRTDVGHYPYDNLTNWLRNPMPLDTTALSWAMLGLVVTVALSILRINFVWWPFHPIGYVVANSQGGSGIDWYWFSLFIGWFCKWITVRYGGMKMYRRAVPFFIGLVLGDYAISALWALFYLATGVTGYRTFPI